MSYKNIARNISMKQYLYKNGKATLNNFQDKLQKNVMQKIIPVQ